jgi:purine-binding chemotaxis protein CheW
MPEDVKVGSPKDKKTIGGTEVLLTVDENSFQIIGFRLGEEEFGVDIFAVKEIIRMSQMTRVPNAPPFVVGVFNMRGKVIPIIDLCIRFGLPVSDIDNTDKKIIVIEHEAKTVGFLVDAVNEVATLNRSITEPPPPMVSGIESAYITAIAKLDNKLLILLEVSKILIIPDEAGFKH